jgi:hypothetical protein
VNVSVAATVPVTKWGKKTSFICLLMRILVQHVHWKFENIGGDDLINAGWLL